MELALLVLVVAVFGWLYWLDGSFNLIMNVGGLLFSVWLALHVAAGGWVWWLVLAAGLGWLCGSNVHAALFRGQTTRAMVARGAARRIRQDIETGGQSEKDRELEELNMREHELKKLVEERDHELERLGDQVPSYSQKREGLLGDRFIEHFNKRGESVGTSREATGLLGEKYTEHRNSSGRVTGTTREETDLFGNEKHVHRD